MSNEKTTAAPCDHITTGCDACDPPGPVTSVFGDADGDFDAQDAQELLAEVEAAQWDHDPNPYEGNDAGEGCFGDDF